MISAHLLLNKNTLCFAFIFGVYETIFALLLQMIFAIDIINSAWTNQASLNREHGKTLKD